MSSMHPQESSAVPAGRETPLPERPLRVLLVSNRYRPVFSGAAQRHHAMLKELGPARIKATVLTPYVVGSARKECLDGIEIRRLGSARADRLARVWFAICTVLQVLRLGRSHDAIHCLAAGWATFVIPVIARLLAVPTLFSSTLQHADDAGAIRAQRLGRSKVWMLRRYTRVATNTPHQWRPFLEAGFPPDALRTLTCCVDDRFYVPGRDVQRREQLRRFAGRKEDGPVLLFIGTLTRRKGVDLLLESFRRNLPRDPESVLVLLGPASRQEDSGLDESFVGELRSRCQDTELRNHVLFLGRVDSAQEKRAVLQASDALALFSVNEGLGNVILEAMSCGLPAILTPIPGVFDYVITDGVDGRIAGSRDPAELADLLHEILSSPERAAALGRKGRETVTSRFSQREIAGQYLELCRELTRGKHGART